MDLSLFTLYHVRRPRFAPGNLHDPDGRTGMAGPPSLLAAVKEAGWSAEAENFFVYWDEVSTRDVRRLASRLLASRGRYLGVGSLSLFLPLLLPALQAFRRERPDTPVILGGYGPSEAAERILALHPFVDVVVRGEGERTLPALLEALDEGRSLRDIPGLSARDGQGVFSTPPAPRIDDLGALPFPDYEGAGVHEFESMAVQLSRGCPYFCSFCSISAVWQPRSVRRPLDRAVEEIDTLVRRHGIHDIVMADDTFNLSRPRVMEFCDALQALGHRDLWWHAFMRADRADEALLARMAEAGCGQVLYGVETGAQEVLEREKDGVFRLEDAVELAWTSAAYFDNVMLCFVYGYPEETWEDYLRTLRLILHLLENDVLNRLQVILDPVFPYPSTPIVLDQALTPVEDPRLLLRRYRAGHRLSRKLLQEDPALCTYSVNVPSPLLEAKHRMTVDLWDVLEGLRPLDDFVKRYERALRDGEPPRAPARGSVTRFLQRVLHPTARR